MEMGGGLDFEVRNTGVFRGMCLFMTQNALCQFDLKILCRKLKYELVLNILAWCFCSCYHVKLIEIVI